MKNLKLIAPLDIFTKQVDDILCNDEIELNNRNINSEDDLKTLLFN
ncbi:hypothetical protein LV85_02360 [Algoriphagus chordae]|uniref:Uncharacterized protein n=1 Tax=Algoriphagus chordae TaxID=237019 RepID=A0A2W7QW59_9BACT|nr:hypothetical protein LV85_02360 [Algoriphagus chordae]